jgi:hypothetical protein
MAGKAVFTGCARFPAEELLDRRQWKTHIVGKVCFGAALGTGYGRVAGQMTYFIQKPHVAKPANMTLVHFTTGTDHIGIMFYASLGHVQRYRVVTWTL